MPVQTCHHLNHLHIYTHFSFYYNRKRNVLCFIMIKSVGNYLANLSPMQVGICHFSRVIRLPQTFGEKNSFEKNHIFILLLSYNPNLIFLVHFEVHYLICRQCNHWFIYIWTSSYYIITSITDMSGKIYTSQWISVKKVFLSTLDMIELNKENEKE